jgi:RNA polymerase sigma-70 factor (ECF subfamily)
MTTAFGMFRTNRQTEQANTWAAFEGEALPHMNDLFRVAMWLVGNRTAAEDLVQETLTQALQSFHRFARGTNCRAWLITIMYRINSKMRRSETRLRLVSDEDARIAETVAIVPPIPQTIREGEVLQALRELPQQFQEVVVLSDIEDMSYKEIAAALSIPVGTVMSRLSRGRKLLRSKLAAYANQFGIGEPTEQDQDTRSLSQQSGGKSDVMS